MPQEPFLVLRDLAKSFGPVAALRSVSLSVGPDELLVVLGPTGAGKTTLLRTIAGLETPDSGRVEMAGRDVTNAAPAERDVALVFQNFSLYPDRTVRGNLEFPLRAPGRGLSKAEIAERVEWAARLLRIERLLDRKSNRLSGGEMQRVAIGRAIVRRPRLFLMDEPLTNLDAKLREGLRVELTCLRRELGIPMVFVTHDQDEALSMGDRVVVLQEGRVLQTGTPEEVYRRPANPEVARQLGQPSINLIEVDSGTAAGGVRIPGAAAAPGPHLAGIRPEDLRPRGGAHRGVVQVVEDVGASQILLVDWSGTTIHILTSKAEAFRPGDEVHPQPDPDGVIAGPGGGPGGTAGSPDFALQGVQAAEGPLVLALPLPEGSLELPQFGLLAIALRFQPGQFLLEAVPHFTRQMRVRLRGLPLADLLLPERHGHRLPVEGVACLDNLPPEPVETIPGQLLRQSLRRGEALEYAHRNAKRRAAAVEASVGRLQVLLQLGDHAPAGLRRGLVAELEVLAESPLLGLELQGCRDASTSRHVPSSISIP